MRFFSNEARETNDDHPDRPVDDSAVPQQHIGSPWSATPTDSPDTPDSADGTVDRDDGKVDEQDGDSVETRAEDDGAKADAAEADAAEADNRADTDTDAEADADAPFAGTPVESGSDSTTYTSAAAADDTVADGDDTVAEDPTPADSADSAIAVAAVPVAAVAAHAASEPAKPGSVPEKNLDSLFGADSAKDFQERWREVQLRFVDSPKDAAAEAAGLVDEAVDRLTASLKAQKDTLLSDSDDTEKLRLELRGYRDILNKILSL